MPGRDRHDCHAVLVGHMPYHNRGCEAIVRGTAKVLRRYLGENVGITLANLAPAQTIDLQERPEEDPAIHHVPVFSETRSLTTRAMARLTGLAPDGYTRDFKRVLSRCDVVLQVAGDTYSLDYGRPEQEIGVDALAMRACKPVVLWCASVGPFESEPEFAREMFEDLRKMAAILVREPTSLDYVQSKGIVRNVWEVADPAFLMDPDTPRPDAGINVPSGAVGFSASQLMSRYVTGGDMAQWRQTAGAIVRRIVADTGHPVLLVPHCTGTEHVDADHVLLAGIQEDLQPDLGDAVTMLPTNLSAAQTKHCIARCEAFVGSRTHSTIAAMSSLVPTVSLAYSVKAPGINTMVFGDTRYCIAPQCQTPEHVSCVLKEALAARTEIRDMLAARIPEIQQKAWIAGEYLARVLTTTGGNKP